MDGILLRTNTVRIRMPNAMLADTLGDSSVITVIQRPFAHVVLAWVVDRAMATVAIGG